MIPSLKDHPVAYLLTVFGTTAALFFTLGSSFANSKVESLETKIEVLELANDLELRELLPELKGASEELRTNLEILNENMRLREENESLVSQLETLTNERDQLIQDNAAIEAELQAKIAEIESFFISTESFTLEENSSKTFGAYDFTVGLTDIQFNDEVAIIFNNERHTMEAGEALGITFDGKLYQLLLDRFDFVEGSADFTLVVRDDDSN